MDLQREEGSVSTPVLSFPRQASKIIKLKKEVRLLEAVAITVGSIIGSGIFVSPKGVIDNCGSVGLALVVWTLSGVIAGIGALCYAELGTSLPGSGGDYHYLHKAFGPIPAFCFLWVSNLIFLPATNAILALTFAKYTFAAFFPFGCVIPQISVQLMAASAILFFTWINCYSIRLTTRIQDVFMFGKIAALLMIITVGLVALCKGHASNYENLWRGTSNDLGNIALAFYSGTFAYSGWNTLNFITEELKSPSKNLPRAIYISVPIVIVIYILTNAAYFAYLSPSEIKASEAVAVTFGDKALGSFKFIIPICVAMSSVGGLSVHIMSASRILFVGARNGHFPTMFSFIQIDRLSPTLSLIFMSVLSLIYLVIPDVFVLINLSTFVFSVSCFAVICAMLYLRWKSPNLFRPIKISLFYPISFALICIYLMVLPVLARPFTILIAVGIIATSLPVYFIFISLKKFHPKVFSDAMDGLTRLIQKMCMSVPQDKKRPQSLKTF